MIMADSVGKILYVYVSKRNVWVYIENEKNKIGEIFYNTKKKEFEFDAEPFMEIKSNDYSEISKYIYKLNNEKGKQNKNGIDY